MIRIRLNVGGRDRLIIRIHTMREEDIAWEIRIRSNAKGRDRVVDLNSLACRSLWLRAMIRICSNVGGRDRAGDSNSLEWETCDCKGRFKFARMREKEIAQEILIRPDARRRDRAGDSNSLILGREIWIRSNRDGWGRAWHSNSHANIRIYWNSRKFYASRLYASIRTVDAVIGRENSNLLKCERRDPARWFA